MPRTLLCCLLLACSPAPGGDELTDQESSVPTTRNQLTGGREVIVTYYPVFPRWDLICDSDFIGDPVRQYPLLAEAGGLQSYGNSRPEDADTLRFDFQAMASAGVTAVNAHFFPHDLELDLALMDRIDAAARASGVRWTPTFENKPPNEMAYLTGLALERYAGGALFRRQEDGRPVFLWYHERSAGEIVPWIDALRVEHPEVVIILDTAGTAAQPMQNSGGGSRPDGAFAAGDATHGARRVDGFYNWVVMPWELGTRAERQLASARTHRLARESGLTSILGVTPSYNEENWGYERAAECGIGGDRSGHPYFNVQRDPAEWAASIDDALGAGPDWLYIQAYDEWGEGSVIAPTTYSCFSFLGTLRHRLVAHSWLPGDPGYCRPAYPAASPAPLSCAETPVCGEPAPGCGRLDVDVRLERGSALASCSGAATLVHQTDGNLVLYRAGVPIWSTGTSGQATSYLMLQGDGNLVLYSADHQPLWSSGTTGQANNVLFVQDDCNLVLVHAGAPTWASGTSCGG